jgi:hypothetical protein
MNGVNMKKYLLITTFGLISIIGNAYAGADASYDGNGINTINISSIAVENDDHPLANCKDALKKLTDRLKTKVIKITECQGYFAPNSQGDLRNAARGSIQYLP